MDVHNLRGDLISLLPYNAYVSFNHEALMGSCFTNNL